MVDLHTHIIPGVDDGADHMNDSLKMVQLSEKSGVTKIVATPHSNLEQYFENFSFEFLEQRVQELNQKIAREKMGVEVVLGMEIYVTDDVAERIAKNQFLSINKSKYYLIEFPFDSSIGWMNRMLEKIGELKNVVPVIAHPERYFAVQSHPERVYRWIMEGCLTQINKGSVLGKFGRGAFRTAMELMEHNLVTCMASDGHTPYMRTTYIKDARDFVAEAYSESYADLILAKRPEKIVMNQEIEMRGMARYAGRHRFWND